MSELVQTSSSGSDLSVIDQIKSKIVDIKEKIKAEGVTSAIFTELSKDAARLQTKLDELLAKRGLITQSDMNDAYTQLQEVKRRELERMKKDSNTRFLLYGVSAVIVTVAIYYLFKKK